jgi:hypothetical protein
VGRLHRLSADRPLRGDRALTPPPASRLPLFIAILTAALTLLLQADAGLPKETATIVWPLAIALFVAAACGAAGRAAGRFLRPLSLSPAEHFLIGALLLGTWIFAIGHLGLLVPACIAAPLVVFALIGVGRTVRRALTNAAPDSAPSPAPDAFLPVSSPIELAGWIVTGAALLWAFAAALAPPTGMDALVYHIGMPIQYLLRGSLLPPDAIVYYTYWQQFEVFATAVLELDPSGVAVNLLNVGFLLAFLDGIRRLARTDSRNSAEAIAVASWATSGLLCILLLHTKNDLMLLALIAAGAVRARGDDLKSALLAGLFLGGAVAVKPSAGYAAGPILLWILWERGARRAAIASAAGALLPAVWALRNLALGGAILPENVSSLAGVAEVSRGLSGFMETLRHLLATFYESSSVGVQGPIGPALLALVAAAITAAGADARICRATDAQLPLARKTDGRASRRQLACLFAGFALWLLTGGGNVRYLLPVLALVTPLGASLVASSGLRILFAALAVSWVVSLGVQVQYGEGINRFLMLHTGRIARAHHAREWLNSYFVQADANRILPPDAHVISVGEARFFYLRRKVVFDGYWEKSRVLQAAERLKDPALLREELRAAGYSHLLYNLPTLQNAVERKLAEPPSAESLRILEAMLEQCPRTIFDAETGIGVYSL